MNFFHAFYIMLALWGVASLPILAAWIVHAIRRRTLLRFALGNQRVHDWPVYRRVRSFWRARVMHNSRSLMRSINGRQRSAWQGLRR